MTAYVVKNFNKLIFLYFVAHTAVRSLVGGNLERDEAEMILMARDLQLGYGPQLPLYNWVQFISFSLFGANTFALAFVKNFFLAIFYIALFDGLKRILSGKLALFASLGTFLLPNILWESQRAGTHSIALLASIAICLNIMLRIIDEPRRWHWFALGAGIAAGGLSKYNFWIFPITLGLSALWIKVYRQALYRRELWVSGIVAASLLAIPYYWSFTHPELTLASNHKLYSEVPNKFAGLYAFVEQSFLALMLPVFVISSKFLLDRRIQDRSDDAVMLAKWLMGAGLLGILFAGLLASLLNTQSFQARWLLPSYIPVSIALFIWGMEKSSIRSQSIILLLSASLGMLTLIAMAANRLTGTTGNALDMETLASSIEQNISPIQQATVLGSNYFYTGNLALLRPEWQVEPPLNGLELDLSGTVVLMEVQNDHEAKALLSSMGIAGLLEKKSAQFYIANVPYNAASKSPRKVPFATLSADHP